MFHGAKDYQRTWQRAVNVAGVTSAQMSELAVLVADDDPVSRTVVAAILRKGGYEVRTASDGAEAWSVLQAPAPPPLAVIDWMMPGLDGPEICRRLRTRATQPSTYVILLTSRDAPGDVVAGLEAGADDYVTKPTKADELLARLSVGVRAIKLRQELADRETRRGGARGA
jgi:DNA-binding response OmpR family regulator